MRHGGRGSGFRGLSVSRRAISAPSAGRCSRLGARRRSRVGRVARTPQHRLNSTRSGPRARASSAGGPRD